MDRSAIAVAMAKASSYSLDSTLRLGTSYAADVALKKKKVACILLYRILKKPVLKIQDLMELSETVLKKKKKKAWMKVRNT